MSATLELYAGPDCCPLCGGRLDVDVWHDDINGQQTCEACCCTCNQEETNSE